jgi:hypothetical protein
MPHMPHVRTARVAALTVLASALAACGGEMKTPEYANDGDTGAGRAGHPADALAQPVRYGRQHHGLSRGSGEGKRAGDTAGAFG